MNEQAIFYNATALALDGNPYYIRKAKKQHGGLHGSWKRIYNGVTPLFEAESVNPEVEWEKLGQLDIRLILFEDPEYPSLLREISDPPLGLYVRGKIPDGDKLAVVGTRRGTSDGKSTTKKFACALANAGFVIVSGLAFGIDAAAHEGCLESSRGKTVAVLAGGLNDIYPSTNEHLAKKILETGGALISEYPLGSPPFPSRFLERNRIVSGLSQGTLVVESPKNSGSLATARFALEQNRDVFVVPGAISHPNFFGSHSLIRQGATLVTKPDDILEAYDMLDTEKIPKTEMAATVEEKHILIVLRDAGRALDVDKIIEATRLEPRIANRTLSFLLLKNLIVETEAGYIIE